MFPGASKVDIGDEREPCPLPRGSQSCHGVLTTWILILMLVLGHSIVGKFAAAVWFGLLLSWTFPITLVRFACWWFNILEQQSPSKPSKTVLDWGRNCRVGGLFRILVLMATCRYGEALHPGPLQDESFGLGVFNPSGLTSKTAILASMPGDTWLGSETHLTHDGVKRLARGLRALGSQFTYAVPGHPCPIRTKGSSFSGVLAVSRFPTRALPHDIPQAVYETSRVQVCGIAVGNLWIQAGIMYGLPDSPQYLHRTYQTDAMLDTLVERIGCQADGPRAIGGDFNHHAGQLASIGKLRMLGFCEIQEIACYLWGQSVCPTSKGADAIDQLWISRELQSLLVAVRVHDQLWADHVALEARFQTRLDPLQIFDWHMPTKFPWPQDWDVNIDIDWSQPSGAYAAFWYQVENAAAQVVQQRGGSVASHAYGRGRTLETQTKFINATPCKLGRVGSEQPGFYGTSLQHVRWFKQLRRLQSLANMLRCSQPKPMQSCKLRELWHAIRCAPGFEKGFCRWWNIAISSLPIDFRFLPPADTAQLMFEAFRTEVRAFERRLKAHRYHAAKTARQSQPQLLFQDVARDSPEKVDSLVQDVQVEVAQVLPEDASITLTSPATLDWSLPLVVQGHPHRIHAACHDQVWLDSVDSIAVGAVARQQIRITSDQGIMQAFQSVWSSRWNKLSHLCDSQWQQIVDFCSRTFRPCEWHFSEITPTRLSQAFHRKKKKSAVGPDGVSRSDALALPPTAVQQLCQLFPAVESGVPWPCQLVQGFVSSLHKGRGDGGVDSYRPIVVYPLVVRSWSSIRAKEALASIHSYLPPSIYGGVQGCQAKTIWFQVAQLLEAAYMTHSSLQGVVVDIQRCFNALPRWPIWHLLSCLNFPIEIARAWASFLGAQQRRFKVRRSVSEGVGSVTGFPEGCALSVFAIALVDMMLDAWLAALSPPVHSVFTYIDDWHVLANCPDDILGIWESLQSFSQALDLCLDIRKSFVWSAQTSDRSQLQDGPLHILLASRALGAHHNFCRRRGNRTLVERLQTLTSLWPRLRASPCPYAGKRAALTQVAWPRAFYGVSVVAVGHCHFVKCRTGALRSLKADRIGASPIAHLATNGLTCDPEAFAIIQTFREVRDVSNHRSIQAMLQWIGSCMVDFPENGPAAILVGRIRRLGWHVQPNGLIRDQFGAFSILDLPWNSLVARVRWAWPGVMSCELSHRKSFSGIQWAWLEEATRLLRRFSPQDQVVLRCAMDGTLYHDLYKPKAARGTGSKCIYCNNIDSVHHRLWNCPHFASCRQGFAWPDLVDILPPAMVCHGWPLFPTAWRRMQCMFNDIPPAAVDLQLPKDPKVPMLDFFTDGSCAHPADACLRFSAWAVTLAHYDHSVLEHSVVACGHTSGQHQSAYRAELEAMVVTLELIAQTQTQARIWCDCLGVVRRTKHVLAGGNVKINRPHHDLWLRVQATCHRFSEGQVQIIKVASHIPTSCAVTGIEEWAYWHNCFVDAAASAYNFKRSPEFWATWNECQTAVRCFRTLLSGIFQVILRVARLTRQQQEPRDQSPPETDQSTADDRRIYKHFSVRRTWGFSGALVHKYKHRNVSMLHQWWVAIGVPALTTRGPLVWVSGLQLYLDFYFTSQFRGMLSTQHGKWYESELELPRFKPGAGKRATMFLRVWAAYLKWNQMLIPHALVKPDSGAINHWAMSWRLPWPRERLGKLDDAILEVVGHQLARPGDAAMVDFPIPSGW